LASILRNGWNHWNGDASLTKAFPTKSS
jgi:hypothetical protein